MRISSLALTAATLVSLAGAQAPQHQHAPPRPPGEEPRPQVQQQQQKPFGSHGSSNNDQDQQSQSPLQNAQAALSSWFDKAKAYVPSGVIEFGNEILRGDGGARGGGSRSRLQASSQSQSQSAPLSAQPPSGGAGPGREEGLEREKNKKHDDQHKKPSQFAPPPPLKPKRMYRVTSANWQRLWAPVAVEKGKDAQDVEPEKLEWLVLVTGGNTTCHGGGCRRLNAAWKASVPLFTADPTSPSLGVLDCEDQKWLCTMWHALPSTLWHIQLPTTEVTPPETPSNNEITTAPHVGRPPTKFSHVPVNRTTVTPEAIYDVHSSRQWETVEPYTGYFHPFDSWLARSGLAPLVASVIYVGGKIPSWLVFLAISSFSRYAAWRQPAPRRGRARSGARPQ